jgi:D-alanine-D-alanine ligase
VSNAHKPRVLVVHNRDFEAARADPENLAREDIRGTAEDVGDVLARAGFGVDLLGIGDDVLAATADIIRFAPDAVFNLCESIAGDNSFEPLLPLLLDHAGIAYTGSPPLTLGLSLHKHRAKDLLRACGIATPEARLVTDGDVSAVELPFPLIVKPSREDGSVGITNASVVHDRGALAQQVSAVLTRYRQPALVERYIEGREIYVSLLARPEGAPQMLPLYEIDFQDMPADRPRIVSFEGKWVESSPEFVGTKPIPCAPLPEQTAAAIARLAAAAFSALELRDYGRFDLRVDRDGTPFVIDVNPNCDLSRDAGFARACGAAGIDYDDLIRLIVDLALGRRPHADTIPLAGRSRATHRNHLSGSGLPTGRGVLRDRAARRRARSG